MDLKKLRALTITYIVLILLWIGLGVMFYMATEAT